MNEKELTHIDLFSGIGGFTLAAEWAGFKTVIFCEKEKFCQEVLQKRFRAVIADSKYLRKLQPERSKQNKWKWISDSPIIIPEIRDFDGTKYRGATLLTGGFPCQPFSVAGQRRGKEDDRYLWPEMLRVIGEAKPRWILAENVPGIFRMALDTVLADLEGEGYTTGTFIIPACGLNAPHRRNRIWIVGYSASQRKMSISQQRQRNGIKPANKTFKDSSSKRLEGRDNGNKGIEKKPNGLFSSRPNSDASNSQRRKSWKSKTENRRQSIKRGDWEKDWYEVAACFCRMDDGVSDRVHRLKALGNAIVPQIAYEILKNIAWIENNERRR